MTRWPGAVRSLAAAIAMWSCVALAVLALIGTVVMSAHKGQLPDALLWTPFCMSFVVVGVVILVRSANRTMGWLFLFVGTDVACSLWFHSYASAISTMARPGAAWAAVGMVVTIWLSLAVFLVLQLFPDGRALTPRWRWLVGATAGVITLGISTSVLSEQSDFSDNFPALTHPLQVVPPAIATPVFAVAQFASLALFAMSAVCLSVRFTRSRGLRRQQMKWLVAASALAATAFVVPALLPTHIDISVAFAVFMPLVPLACGVAILRYRLYDIDRIVGRTTSYALVTGVLLMVYVVVVTSLTQLVPESGSTGAPDSWAVAVATLVAAALFRPVLGWAHRVVARRFNREQYDAHVAVEVFARELRDEVEPEHVKGSLLKVVNRTIQPSGVVLWLRDGTV